MNDDAAVDGFGDLGGEEATKVHGGSRGDNGDESEGRDLHVGERWALRVATLGNCEGEGATVKGKIKIVAKQVDCVLL